MTPDEFTNQEFFLDVGDGHSLYVHDWGKKDAEVPIVFLHGGPGNGCYERDKDKFDPNLHRVIFHDQRGAGKSLPAGSLEHNTAQDLVDDIEKIVERLRLKTFVVVGGSWGSTLALLYGIAHPKRVKAMVLDGVFTSTQEELAWLNEGGWRAFYPDVWQDYLATVPATHRADPSAYHYRQMMNSDPETAKQSVYAFIGMEIALLKLDTRYKPKPYDDFDVGGGLIEMHFLANKCFLKEGYILEHANKLKMPVWLVQGRYDMVCPPQAAHRLQAALPDGHMVWTINGHLRQHEAANVQRLLVNRATGVE